MKYRLSLTLNTKLYDQHKRALIALGRKLRKIVAG